MPVCVFTEPAELARHFFGEWWQREGQENGADATRPGGQARLVQNNWRDKENAMNYESVIRDFAERTRKNLRTIEDLQAKGGEAYEVTQLVNSMLGLLVFPRERFFDQIPQTSLSDLEADGWPVPKVVGDFPQARDLRELIRYLRNADRSLQYRIHWRKDPICQGVEYERQEDDLEGRDWPERTSGYRRTLHRPLARE